ncbi:MULTISPECIES: hypothetical protein [unclassified Pedobacter]|uniref:hypothetical protein n=1 Tax=unclassified Pedobacter TaxID=2628915 RepID=UPI001424971A|nr:MULTISPECIES: hypothetical protein [unclassified Pedobacter]NII81700.1 hypothetical protein [Pedobacter sp. SG908]NMN35704.1 hypothetical protein [Pedobacter sp. SG918]
MARNKIADLNDHLFAQLERLNDEDLSKEDLDKEIDRAKAMSGIANQIINANKLTLEAVKLVSRGEIGKTEIPDNFGVKAIG